MKRVWETFTTQVEWVPGGTANSRLPWLHVNRILHHEFGPAGDDVRVRITVEKLASADFSAKHARNGDGKSLVYLHCKHCNFAGTYAGKWNRPVPIWPATQARMAANSHARRAHGIADPEIRYTIPHE